MSKIRFISGLALLFCIAACSKKYTLAKSFKTNADSLSFFVCTSWEDADANKFYGASNQRQKEFLVKKLKLKIWRGYWDGMERDGIIIIKNNHLYGNIYQNVITKSNISTIKDSLTLYKKNSKSVPKKEIRNFLDSLKREKIQHYLLVDTSSFNGEQLFKINCVENASESGHCQLLCDSTLNNFKTYFPGRDVRISRISYTGQNRDYLLSVSAKSENEIKEFDKEILTKIKSNRNITIEDYKPFVYYVVYFLNY